MGRKDRDFYQRSEDDQQAFLTQTWCNECMEADLGMKDPQEYIEDDKLIIEGKCNKCGNPVITELIDDDIE